MEQEVDYVRSLFPRAEASVKGGTGEMAALGMGEADDERWVIFADNCPDAEQLGEGSTIQSAWQNAAKKLQSNQS
jgi:hypothetical protein